MVIVRFGRLQQRASNLRSQLEQWIAVVSEVRLIGVRRCSPTGTGQSGQPGVVAVHNGCCLQNLAEADSAIDFSPPSQPGASIDSFMLSSNSPHQTPPDSCRHLGSSIILRFLGGWPEKRKQGALSRPKSSAVQILNNDSSSFLQDHSGQAGFYCSDRILLHRSSPTIV